MLLYSTLQSGKQSPFNRFSLNNCAVRNSYYKVKKINVDVIFVLSYLYLYRNILYLMVSLQENRVNKIAVFLIVAPTVALISYKVAFIMSSFLVSFYK